uniref:Uncharacterized protein n=1 Tax=Avena sativa TaxID=4498 RepID=A0ACD5UBN7_AVESA
MAKDGSIFSSDIKLDGSNYREWEFSVRTIVRDADYDEHLTDDHRKEDEATMKSWQKIDAKVMGALILNVTPSLRMNLKNHSTAKEIWKYLEQQYLQPSRALRYSLLQNLQNLQQQEMSIEGYHAALTRISSQLMSMIPKSGSGCEACVAKKKYEAESFMFQFVMRLRQEFENNLTQLLGRTTAPPFLDKALSSLIAEETRLRYLASFATPMTHTSILVAPRGPFRGSFSGKFRSHYKKSGHTIDSCFVLHLELLAEYQRKFPAQQQHRHPSTRKSSAILLCMPLVSLSLGCLIQEPLFMSPLTVCSSPHVNQ